MLPALQSVRDAFRPACAVIPIPIPIRFRFQTRLACIILQDEKGEQRQVRVDQFPVASELLNGLMAAVMREVRRSDTLRGKLYQVRLP